MKAPAALMAAQMRISIRPRIGGEDCRMGDRARTNTAHFAKLDPVPPTDAEVTETTDLNRCD